MCRTLRLAEIQASRQQSATSNQPKHHYLTSELGETVMLPNIILPVLFSCSDAPADDARCACVNRQWRTSSRSAYPNRLVID